MSSSSKISSQNIEPNLRTKDKVRIFLSAHWRGVITLVAPIALIGILAPFPPQKFQWCAYCLLLMAVFWVTECIPLPVTSFLPIVIFPMSGVMNTAQTCKCYLNDSIMMSLGSMFLANAIEQSGLHTRLALCAIRLIGYSHMKLLFAMSFITMFVSMWISNTAATTMMVPINFAVLKIFEEQNLLQIYIPTKSGDKIASDITTCYFCSATFSATNGGIGTLVGTSTNLVFKGLFMKTYPKAPEYLSFPKFSAYSIPCMICMNLATYLYMTMLYLGFLRKGSNAAKSAEIPLYGIKAAREKLEEDWAKLGRLTYYEFIVALLFFFAIILFFCRSPQIFIGWGDKIIESLGLKKKFIEDSSAAMLVAFLMMLIPSSLTFFDYFRVKYFEDLPHHRISSVLNWEVLNSIMPFSFTFLLGAGFALSTAAKKEYSDLNGKIGNMLNNLSSLPNPVAIFITIVFTVIVTNFASNVAIANVVVPIALTLANKLKVNPLWYALTAGFSASFCYCFPVGTPGNLVVQSAAKIPTLKMIKSGIGPTISTIIINFIFLLYWAPVIWDDLGYLPSWIY